MTELTRSHIFRTAWPLILAQAAVPLAGAADTFVLGLAGTTSDLAGVALGVAIFNVVAMSVYFLRMGTTALVSQAAGADDWLRMQAVLVRAVALALLIGAIAFALRGLVIAGGLTVLQGSAPVKAAAAGYVDAVAFGAPAKFAVFALTGWLIGARRTGAMLWVLAIFSAVNIGLDLVFVLHFGLGPAGVGYATAIADWVAAGIGAFFVLGTVVRHGGWHAHALHLADLVEPAAVRELFDVNFNLMLRTWTLLIGFTWFVNAGARQGDAMLAGNHVLMQVIMLWAFVLDAFAFVGEAETGRAYGAGSVRGLRRAFRLVMEMSLVIGGAMALATWILGPAVLTTLVQDEPARNAALAFLPYCAAVPLIGAPAWVLDGVFIGATRGRMMRNAALASLLVYLAADALLASSLGNHGVWLAFLVYYLARAATLAAYYPHLEARVGRTSRGAV